MVIDRPLCSKILTMRIKQLLKSRGKSFLLQTMSFVVSGMMVTSLNAQTSTITIGTGTSTTTTNPITSCWSYSYTQQIYTAAELNAQGITGPATISSLGFYYNSGAFTNSTDWTVYIGNSAQASFPNNTSWVPLANLTQVFTGTATYPAAGNWMTITFATPFAWDGTSNIVVAVDENQPNYNCSVNWRYSYSSPNRAIYYRSDSDNPDPAGPPTAYSTTGNLPNIQFEVTPFPDCSGSPAMANIVSANGSNLCVGDDVALSLDMDYNYIGISYQWQAFNGSTYDDIIGATESTLDTSDLQVSTSYQAIVTCDISGMSTTLAPISITANALPTVLVDVPESSICSGDAATITATGATSYTWSPATGLSNTNMDVVDANPTSTTVYTVTGTDANGCTNVATSTIIPNSSVMADVVINPADICESGSAVSATIGGSIPSNSAGGVWNYRFLEADGVTEAQTWSTNDVFNFIPTEDSIYSFYYQLNNTACTEAIDSVLFNFIVGFGGDVTTIDYDCNNLGGTISLSNTFGQADISVVYANDFSASADLSALSFTGAAAISNDRAVITPSATSTSGAMMITIPGFSAGVNNSMNVNFDLTTDLPINNWGTGGADGITYSFGDDANPGATGNGINGKGSKLRLSFDTAPNGTENGNAPGIYLVYGWTAGNAFGPGSTQTLAYSSNTTWKGGTDVPVSFAIDVAGRASLWVDGVLIFENVQLPASYLTEDVSSWTHLFSAGTGGDAERHAIDNFEISSGSLFYGLSQGLPTDVPTVWQNSTEFAGLVPGIYHVWLAKDETAACGKNIETIEIINTDPVVALGNDTTICEGTTLVLDAENVGSTYVWSNNPATTQTIDVTTTGSYAAYVTAPNGCTAIGSIYVEVIDAPTASGITMQGNWQSYSFTVDNPVNGVTYDWNFGDGTTAMNASSSVSHVYWTEGNFDVTVTISNDCGSTDVTEQFVIANVAGINDIELEGLSIYPNPTSTELTIALEDATPSTVTVSTIEGAIVVANENFNGAIKMNVQNWERGVYFVTVSNNGISTTQRVVVQ